MPQNRWSLGNLLRLAPPEPEPWQGPVEEIPETRPDGWLENAFDVFAGALGLPGTPGTRAYTMGELLSAAVPVVGGVKALRAVKGAKAPIKAYHGSPHDFDQFSLSKIGTGEGAQAYGHGLYFADNEGVARSYRDSLAAKSAPKSQGGIDLQELYQYLPDEPTTMAQAQSDFGRLVEMGAIEPNQEKQFLDLWDQNIRAADKGRMYEVNINADPEDFLDWDAPLSQQSEKVQKVLGPNWRMRNDMRPEATGSAAFRKLGNMGPNELAARMPPGEQSAEGVLKARGIPGIKYLDGASRAAGQGTRNYVVFDDKLIDIVKKYGIAGAIGAGMINQAQARQLQAQGYE